MPKNNIIFQHLGITIGTMFNTKLKIRVVEESCIIVYGHTCVEDYWINSVSKLTLELNFPSVSMICFCFHFFFTTLWRQKWGGGRL